MYSLPSLYLDNNRPQSTQVICLKQVGKGVNLMLINNSCNYMADNALSNALYSLPIY